MGGYREASANNYRFRQQLLLSKESGLIVYRKKMDGIMLQKLLSCEASSLKTTSFELNRISLNFKDLSFYQLSIASNLFISRGRISLKKK